MLPSPLSLRGSPWSVLVCFGWIPKEMLPGDHQALVIFHGDHTEMIFGSNLQAKRCLWISAFLQNRDSPLHNLERSCKHVLIKTSESSAKSLGQSCDVLALPCPSMGISPSSHLFSLIVLHFHHLLLSIFSFSLFLTSNSVLLIFLTNIFSWDTS